MNTTGYIIEPSWFYWLNVMNSSKIFLAVVMFVCVVFIIIGVIEISVDMDMMKSFPHSSTDYAGQVQRWKKWLKVFVAGLIVCGLGIIFIPSQETLITMMVAKYATYENVGLTVDALKGAVDYIIQSIQSLK